MADLNGFPCIFKFSLIQDNFSRGDAGARRRGFGVNMGEQGMNLETKGPSALRSGMDSFPFLKLDVSLPLRLRDFAREKFTAMILDSIGELMVIFRFEPGFGDRRILTEFTELTE